jgi:hypothetical protein
MIDPLEMEQARLAATSQVDFICPPQSIWNNKEAALETVRGYNAMIGEIQIEAV